MYMFKYPLQSLYFSDRSEIQNGRPAAGLWLTETFSTSPLKLLNRIQRNLKGSNISTSSTNFMFFGPIEKKPRWTPDLWLAGAFSTSRLKPLNGIWPKLTGSKISTSMTDRKTKMTAQHLIGWDIFDFSSETAARNSTKIHWKQDLNVFYQVFVFGRSEKQPPQPLMGETFTTSPMKQLNKIQRNMTVSKISTSSTKFVG